MPDLILFTDGGARGNPGPAGIGVVVKDPSGEILDEISEAIGWTTNNVAEYRGLIRGLEAAVEREARHVLVNMDSLLVVQQMKGVFKVKHANLKPLSARARALVKQFDSVEFRAIPREHNSEADRLVNEAVDVWQLENPDFLPPEKAEQEELF